MFTSESYTFDSLSRMTTRAFGTATPIAVAYTNSAHVDAPTSYNGYTYAYDANGNQISRTISSSTQTRTFDPEGRVTQIISGTYTTSYIYDANGTRVIKSVTAAGLGSGVGNSLPAAGATQRTLYVGSYEEELPTNQPAKWSSVTNASVSSTSNVLQKTGTSYNWDAGAISTQSIASTDANGYVSVVADATNTHRMFGLGNTNQSASYDDIEFGLHLMDDGTMEILESGANKGNVGSYHVGDVLKVADVNGAVKYYRNDTLLYTSSAKISYPLYLDTSIWTPGARLVGGLICAGSACTNSPTTPPYTSFYSFGEKLVGMRRANYPTSESNGQFRIVGDHLGSTTLILDVSSPPNVVQRQYSKPYGETAWQYTASSTGSQSLTNIEYTGQRTDEDSTGLLFYGARTYDPVSSFFTSADTVGPNPTEPRTYSRYGYALSNPLRYSDPTGHTPEDYEKCKNGDKEACRADFADLGASMEGNWDWDNKDNRFWELVAVLDGIHAMMAKADWSYGDFKHAMGISDGHKLNLKRLGNNDQGYQAWEDHELWDNSNTINFYNGAFNPSDKLDASVITVHELAHVWDSPNLAGHIFGYSLSNQMKWRVIGCEHPNCAHQERLSPDDITGHAHDNAGEDFAEAVAAYVYPDSGRWKKPDGSRRNGYIEGSVRWRFVKEKFAD